MFRQGSEQRVRKRPDAMVLAVYQPLCGHGSWLHVSRGADVHSHRERSHGVGIGRPNAKQRRRRRHRPSLSKARRGTPVFEGLEMVPWPCSRIADLVMTRGTGPVLGSELGRPPSSHQADASRMVLATKSQVPHRPRRAPTATGSSRPWCHRSAVCAARSRQAPGVRARRRRAVRPRCGGTRRWRPAPC
jgi:hypothetical protein